MPTTTTLINPSDELRLAHLAGGFEQMRDVANHLWNMYQRVLEGSAAGLEFEEIDEFGNIRVRDVSV